mgnify:CR=1 FL=1
MNAVYSKEDCSTRICAEAWQLLKAVEVSSSS